MSLSGNELRSDWLINRCGIPIDARGVFRLQVRFVPNPQLRAITKASAPQVKRSHLVRGMCCRSTNSLQKAQRSICFGAPVRNCVHDPSWCGRVHVGEQGEARSEAASGETRRTPGLATNLDTSRGGCRLACGALIRSGKVVFLSGSARIEFPADEYITLCEVTTASTS
jgi:hypothetical protein